MFSHVRWAFINLSRSLRIRGNWIEVHLLLFLVSCELWYEIKENNNFKQFVKNKIESLMLLSFIFAPYFFVLPRMFPKKTARHWRWR